MENIAKIVMLIGVVFIAIGAFMYFGDKYLPLFRLPGDIYFNKGNFNFALPLTTSIVLSILLTVLMNIFFR